MCQEQTGEVIKPVEIEIVGYLVYEDDTCVTLAMELVGDEFRNQVSIPKVAILDSRSIQI